jgi:very-short-patch-repair endonuclease
MFKPSYTENIILKKLEKLLDVKIERQFRLDNKLYDGRIGRILLEIDGIFWHSKTKDRINDHEKDKIARNHGFKLIRLRISSLKDINNVIASNIKLIRENL